LGVPILRRFLLWPAATLVVDVDTATWTHR